MNQMFFRALLIATLLVTSSLLLTSFYRRYTGLNRWQSALLCLLAAGVPIAFLLVFPAFNRNHSTPDAKPVICAIFLSLLAVPFAVRLYRKWIGGQLTDSEKLPGMDGVRAWLTPGNLICATLIPICAWQVFQVSLPAMFMLTFGLLLAYPAFNLASAVPQTAPAGPTVDLSGEREKVLQLLEAGKITADESAELLNALGQSIPRRPQPLSEADLSPQRKIVLLGAALLLVGFFLPWFNINPGQMLHEATVQMQQMMNGMVPGNAMPQMNVPTTNGTIKVHAGDVAHGLGWWILTLGIGAAVLPFFATTLKAGMQKKVILAALAVGAFLLVYLLSDTLRYVSVGVMLALAGYALEIVGTLKERPVAH